MQILITDETNLEPGDGIDFFVYGGLFLPVDVLPKLTESMGKIRAAAGYKPEDKLKFDTRVRPEYVTIEAATEAKKKVVELCLELECKFVTYLILHDTAKAQSKDTRVIYGINSVLERFHRYLEQNNEYGIVLADVLPVTNGFQYLAEVFSSGLKYDSGRIHFLNRICMLGQTSINSSCAASAVDIVLGSFRYCINNPKNKDAASQMMLNVIKMMWHRREGDTYHVHSRGLVSRPIFDHIRVESYKQRYKELIEHINNLLSLAEE